MIQLGAITHKNQKPCSHGSNRNIRQALILVIWKSQGQATKSTRAKQGRAGGWWAGGKDGKRERERDRGTGLLRRRCAVAIGVQLVHCFCINPWSPREVDMSAAARTP
jgi:hypothetical protein